MSDDLTMLRQQVAGLVAEQEVLRQRYEQAQVNIDKWDQQALLIVRQQIEDRAGQINRLKADMAKLEAKLALEKVRLSMFNGNSDYDNFDQNSGVKNPNFPPSKPGGVEADPDIDGQAYSSIL